MSCNDCNARQHCLDAYTEIAVHCNRYDKEMIYIAGPITGVDGYEETFNNAEKELEDLGFIVCNPIKPGLVDGADYKYYIDRGLKMLMECDGIYLLKGFNKSKGALLEWHYAFVNGLTILMQEEDSDV